MNNKFKQLPADLQSQKVYQFSSDYFFHYLLIHSAKVRLFLCRFLSKNNDIKYTEVINSEIYGKHHDSKKLILDVVVRDNLGQLYNFEMQNYDFNKGEEIRMMQYLEALIQTQITQGVEYEHIKDVYQMILYTGKPYQKFQSYVHEIQKGDIERQLTYQGDKGKTVVYQLEKFKEEVNMEVPLSAINQFMHLMFNNDIDEKIGTHEIIEETIGMHNEFIENEEEIIKALEIQRERLTLSSRIHYAKEEGREEGYEKGHEEGRKKGEKETLLGNVKTAIQSIYKRDDLNWLDNYSYEQLQYAFQLVFKGLDYEEYINKIKIDN